MTHTYLQPAGLFGMLSLLTAICVAIFVFTKTHPLVVVFAAGVLGYFGVV
jgi:hypothetical protein